MLCHDLGMPPHPCVARLAPEPDSTVDGSSMRIPSTTIKQTFLRAFRCHLWSPVTQKLIAPRRTAVEASASS